ncbi:hypothetical protein GCM10027341_07260 [Spirosoma knui]
MRTVLLLITIGVFSFSPAFSQVNFPELPETDYAVYRTIINSFSDCISEQAKHRRGGLLLLKNTTDTISQYGFNFDFKKPERQIRPKSQTDSLLDQTAWRSFIQSVSPSQFTQYSISNRLKPRCREVAIWTTEMNKVYFGKNAPKQGYYGLRKDYQNFDSIISFSKVVYSIDGGKALCYFSEVSDGLAGAGYVVLLEKGQNVWNVVSYFMLWIS